MKYIYGKEKPLHNTDREGFIGFIDAPGGTGKTFGINTFLHYARSQGDIALASAFSGVAALLLAGGIMFSNFLLYFQKNYFK